MNPSSSQKCIYSSPIEGDDYLEADRSYVKTHQRTSQKHKRSLSTSVGADVDPHASSDSSNSWKHSLYSREMTDCHGYRQDSDFHATSYRKSHDCGIHSVDRSSSVLNIPSIHSVTEIYAVQETTFMRANSQANNTDNEYLSYAETTSCDKCDCSNFEKSAMYTSNVKVIEGVDYWNNQCRHVPPQNDMIFDSKLSGIADNLSTRVSTSTSSTAIKSAATMLYRKDVQKTTGAIQCKMIEVAPGEYMPLRGAKETWKAIQEDFYVPCECVGCTHTLLCIQDAIFVLCPVCDVVSPLQQNVKNLFTPETFNGGVGLGFTLDELVAWQHFL